MTTIRIETVRAQRPFDGIERFSMASQDAVRLRPARLSRLRRLPLRWVACIGLVLLAAAGVTRITAPMADARVIAAEPDAPPPSPEPVAIKPTIPVWIEVNRPIHLYELAGSDFGKLDLTYQARRRELGPERQDILRYGGFGGETPSLDLSITRTAPGDEEDASLFVAMARLAAASHLSVVRSGLATSVGTRFGSFETADLMVARGGDARPCLGFQLQLDAAPRSVAIAGFACGTRAKPVDRAALACVLDRIDLVSAGEDDVLRTFFVDAERRRAGECVAPRLLAAGSRTMWMRDPGAATAPRLKPGSGRPAK